MKCQKTKATFLTPNFVYFNFQAFKCFIILVTFKIENALFELYNSTVHFGNIAILNLTS